MVSNTGIPRDDGRSHFVVRILLRIEKLFETAMVNKIGSPLTWLAVLFIVFCILVYHALILLSFAELTDKEYPGAIAFSMICNLISILCLFSCVWCTPLSVLLGLHVGITSTEHTDSSSSYEYLQKLSSAAMQLSDPTSRLLLFGNLIATIANEAGEIMFFLHGFSSDIDDELPPLFASVVYLMSSSTCSLILALGSGYVSLAHNLFASQIEALVTSLEAEDMRISGTSLRAARLQRNSVFDDETFELELPKRNIMSASDDEPSEEIGSLLSTAGGLSESHRPAVSPRKTADISPRLLCDIYFDFRRRQSQMSMKLHRRLGLVFLCLTIETIIMVTQGYSDSSHLYSNVQTVALLCTFFGNSFSLWSMLFSTGRVMYVSREELGFAATKWALEIGTTNRHPFCSDASKIAQMIKDFPLKFHTSIFEWSEDLVRGGTLLLLGLAFIFIGVHVPQL
jgi:hypothetical protein